MTSSPLKTPAARNVAGSRTDGVNQANGPASGAASAGKGTVGLSAAARHLSNLQSGDADINVARVNEIRDALASGQLKIDPSRIADGLIASVRDLLK
ncbi:MAG TPA: flagellar biosynthesis anti-sigma factor FlgM [Candidimonas sp.]|nr:flagellar biosynthesis anti-sigma factor FlgM [Candidimonas sp.]